MASPSHPLAAELATRTAACGFNLVGFVGAGEFDASQPSGRRTTEFLPECGSVFLIGNGGSGLWRFLVDSGYEFAEPAPDYHPIDDYSAAIAAEQVAWMNERGVASQVVLPDDERSLNFMHLAEMAGWGTVSPVIGLLLHPEFGPWVSLRAAILIEREPFGAVAGEANQPFQPCVCCAKPCVDACPVQVFDGMGGIDLDACARHRHADHCGDGCATRRSCPVGADSQYGREEERFRHSYSLFSMRRHFGLSGG